MKPHLIRNLLSLSCPLALLLTAGCSNPKQEVATGFPKDFNSRSDAAKMEYVLKTASPDSAARFVLQAALNQLPGIEIDTVSNAVLFVYSTASSDDQLKFSEEYQRLKDALTPAQRVILFKKGTAEDPTAFGLELGLSYLTRIRSYNLNLEKVEKEIKDFRAECGTDTLTYQRFMTGFTTVLNYDKGKDINKEIYARFSNQ